MIPYKIHKDDDLSLVNLSTKKSRKNCLRNYFVNMRNYAKAIVTSD